MSPLARFWLALGATVAALAVTALLGRRRRRRAHVAGAVVATALLAWTVVEAERLGRVLAIPRAPLVVHLVFANAGALAFLVALGTGARLFAREQEGRRRSHRRAVVLFLVLVACATATGSYMLARSVPRPAASPGGASGPAAPGAGVLRSR